MKINPCYLLIVATLLLMVSCETVRTDLAAITQSTRTTGASINATPSHEHRGGIGGIKIVSINDKPVSRTKAALSRGLNDVKIQYTSPTGKKQEVDLAFKARSNQRYYVKFSVFPPRVQTMEQLGRNYKSSEAAGKIMSLAEGDTSGYFTGAMLVPAFAAGLAEPLVRTAGASLQQRSQAVKHVDVSVVSEDISEGIVRRVRVYPDGKIDAKTWDAWSNAPGKS